MTRWADGQWEKMERKEESKEEREGDTDKLDGNGERDMDEWTERYVGDTHTYIHTSIYMLTASSV